MEPFARPGWQKNRALPGVGDDELTHEEAAADLSLFERSMSGKNRQSSVVDRELMEADLSDLREKSKKRNESGWRPVGQFLGTQSTSLVKRIFLWWWNWFTAAPGLRAQWDRKTYAAFIGKRLIVMAFIVFEVVIAYKIAFGAGGILEMRERSATIVAKKNDVQNITAEHEQLKEEIRKLGKDPRYQREIIRDHLGLISKDEYLIIFPKAP